MRLDITAKVGTNMRYLSKLVATSALVAVYPAFSQTMDSEVYLVPESTEQASHEVEFSERNLSAVGEQVTGSKERLIEEYFQIDGGDEVLKQEPISSVSEVDNQLSADLWAQVVFSEKSGSSAGTQKVVYQQPASPDSNQPAEVSVSVVGSSMLTEVENAATSHRAVEVSIQIDGPAGGAVKAVDWSSSAAEEKLLGNPALEVSFDEVTDSSVSSGIDSSEETPPAASPAPVGEKSGRYVVISSVEFEGNEVLSDLELTDVAKTFIGRRIGLSDLEELRIQLSQAYVDRGYLNSGALLPDQKVEDGRIVYVIVEGEIAKVDIEGEGNLREKYISERILKNATNPFNSFALQENFQLLLDDPLIERLDGQLQTLPEKGKTALSLNVLRAKPYDVSIVASNHGALSLGSQQVLLSALTRNVSGVGDEVGVTLGGNQNKKNIAVYYEIPLSSEETRVRAEISIADSTVVEEPFDTVDIESKTSGIDISVTRDLKRNINAKSTVGTGFALRDNSNTLASEPFSFSRGELDGKSRVAVARVWHDLVQRGNNDVLALRSTLNMGLDMFGSTVHSEELPSSEFFTLQGQLQYSRRVLKNRSQMLLRLDAQLSDSELLPLQRFSLGGATSVRGYRENELVRDRALFASAELRYPVLNSSQYGDFLLVPFLDFGYGANKGQFSAEERLASVGVGVLWNFRKSFAAELYFGAPLRDLDGSDGNSLQEKGMHLQVSAQL